MDVGTGLILALVALLAINQLVMRVGGLRGRMSVFWGLQGLNLAAGAAILWFGVPGLETVPAFQWLLGLLFLFRVVHNNGLRAKWLRESVQTDAADKRLALQAALAAGESSGEGESPTAQ